MNSLLSRICGAALLMLGGCAGPQSYVVLLEGEDGKDDGAVVVSNAQGSRTLDQAGHRLGLNDAESVDAEKVNLARLESEFTALFDAQPEPVRSYLLYFESGRSELTAQSRVLIPAIVDEIKRREAPDIGIIGHTDTAGSETLNTELALERARKVFALMRFAGVDSELIEVSSHGENNPLIDTGDGVDEPRNRRVEVVVR